MFTHRRFATSALLALGLMWGVAVTVTGCGGSPGATASTSPSASQAGGQLSSVINCLNNHGMTVPSGATAKQVEAAFKTLPPSQQQSDFNACSSLMSAKVRQRIQQRLAKATAAG